METEEGVIVTHTEDQCYNLLEFSKQFVVSIVVFFQFG